MQTLFLSCAGRWVISNRPSPQNNRNKHNNLEKEYSNDEVKEKNSNNNKILIDQSKSNIKL